jgi:hypothetical protein
MNNLKVLGEKTLNYFIVEALMFVLILSAGIIFLGLFYINSYKQILDLTIYSIRFSGLVWAIIAISIIVIWHLFIILRTIIMFAKVIIIYFVIIKRAKELEFFNSIF